MSDTIFSILGACCSGGKLMDAKSVLYLERNKIIKIPPATGITDLEYLEAEFRRCFRFENNVALEVTFQRFDEDWNDYVEIEKDDGVFH